VDLPIIPAGLDNATTSALDAARAGNDVGGAARKFQGVLASLLVKEMRRSLPEGFFGDGAAGDIYSGWLDEHVGESLATRDALHLESMLRSSLERKAGEKT
jgi:Rod binding domain-containing protein